MTANPALPPWRPLLRAAREREGTPALVGPLAAAGHRGGGQHTSDTHPGVSRWGRGGGPGFAHRWPQRHGGRIKATVLGGIGLAATESPLPILPAGIASNPACRRGRQGEPTPLAGPNSIRPDPLGLAPTGCPTLSRGAFPQGASGGSAHPRTLPTAADWPDTSRAIRAQRSPPTGTVAGARRIAGASMASIPDCRSPALIPCPITPNAPPRSVPFAAGPFSGAKNGNRSGTRFAIARIAAATISVPRIQKANTDHCYP